MVWRGLDAWRAEYAHVALHADRLLASGTQIGIEPEPYRLQYAHETGPGFNAARFTADATGAGWSRRLELVRASDGTWQITAGETGSTDLPPPGGDPAELASAVDIDLAYSALFNTLPVLRERLLEHREARDFEMAWVSVPDLAVRRFPQRYVPLGDGRVQFMSRDGEFRATIHFDPDGLVTLYEDFIERVA